MGFEGHGAFVLAGLGGFFCLLVEMFLSAEAFTARGFGDAGGAAVGEDARGLGLVVEVGFEDADESAFEGGLGDGDHQLDAFFEVAGHPIGGGDVDFRIAALEEMEDAGVFEEAIDYGNDFDVFRMFRIAGFEAADAADVEFDFNAGA